ncbi:hypothetical protein [Streptomyces sp. NPDC006334]|uniref:hypothetical protein n=1 Tax=Streptomyces sp. NPDC006334 TaxID=3156754 RepID=UPI0033A3DD03
MTSREQDAVRLLLLIDGACEPLTAAEKAMPALEQAVGVMRTQVKLQKLDFWLRNPDYLANELLTEYESEREEALLDIAGRILGGGEDTAVPLVAGMAGCSLIAVLALLLTRGGTHLPHSPGSPCDDMDTPASAAI